MLSFVYAQKARSYVGIKDINESENVPQMRCKKVSDYAAKMQSTQAHAKSNGFKHIVKSEPELHLQSQFPSPQHYS